MAASISVGTVLSISAAQGTDAASYAGLTYTVVGEVTSIGPRGGTAQVIETIPLASGEVDKFIGSINYGSVETVQFSKDLTDAGQLLLTAGFDGAAARTEHSAKFEDAAGNIAYAAVKIASDVTNTGDANSVTGGTVALEIIRKPVIV